MTQGTSPPRWTFGATAWRQVRGGSIASVWRKVWRSPALRVAVIYGASGVGFAGANLVLARILPTLDFALFALVLSLINLSSHIAPAGADSLVNRREIAPDWALLRRVLVTAGIVAAVTAVAGGVLYELPVPLLLLLAAAVMSGGVGLLAAAQFQSMRRFRISLSLSHSANLLVLVAACATWALGMFQVWVPLLIFAVGRVIVAVLGWALLLREHAQGRHAHRTGRFHWPEALAFAGVSAGVLLLMQLDRLMIAQLLPMRDLAVYGVLAAIVSSPFRILQMGTGYTLLPRLRAARDLAERRRLLWHEGVAVACMVVVASVVVWLATPIVLHHVVADRYSIPDSLIVAALVVGLAKVVDAFAKSVVSAMGSTRELTQLSVLGWVAVAIAGGGAVVGARWGLVGLIYGVGLGWWARALFGTWLAIPHVRSTPEHPDGGTPGPAAVTAPPSLVAQEIATAAAQEEGH